MGQTLGELIEKKLERDKTKKYWLIRTYSGNYYEEFKSHGFIGIGWNEIRYSDFQKLPPEEKAIGLSKEEAKTFKLSRKLLIEELAAKVVFSDEKEFASEKTKQMTAIRAVHQTETFIRNIKKGDIVLIPSENSEFYSFGEVVDSSIFLADRYEMQETNCDLIKRKRVEWIMTDVPRYRLDPNFLRFVRVQTTISDITDYGYFVEKTISNDFIMDGQSHFVLRVTEDIELQASHYRALLHVMDLTAEEINEEVGINVNDAEIKARVQSPGEFVLLSQYLPYAGYAAVVILMLVGGGLDSQKEGGFKFGTKGIWGRILESKKHKVEVAEYEKNQDQNRKNQETIRRLLELNPDILKDCERVAIKLLDNQTKDALSTTKGDNDISLQ